MSGVIFSEHALVAVIATAGMAVPKELIALAAVVFD